MAGRTSVRVKAWDLVVLIGRAKRTVVLGRSALVSYWFQKKPAHDESGCRTTSSGEPATPRRRPLGTPRSMERRG